MDFGKENLMQRLKIALLIIAVLSATCAFSQDDPVFKVSKLTDHLYELTADRGGYVVNVVASVGDDGLLLVDTGEKETAEDLKTAVEAFGKGFPKIIINTHAHVDHTGGNAIFGKNPIIIAHDIVRTRLRSGSYLFDEFPDATLPDITFTDSMSLYFNGEEIRLMAFGGSHDDNDIIVWFTGSRVVCVGDISNGLHFPSIEEVTGNTLKFGEISRQIIDILPDDVTIVSGHGEDCTRNGLVTYHDAIIKTTAIVKKELEKGKDRAALVKEDVLGEWASYGEGYVSAELWIDMLVEAFQDTIPRKTIYEPIYYALKEKGTKAAIELYYELKANHFHEYRFKEMDLAFMAIKFFDLCIAEYPDGIYAYYYYYLLGNLYSEIGEMEPALENYEKSYELKATETVAKKIEDLKKE
jgi:glyoxylase-like metal-dependent hydrolase (beta-lactamase superfamily II)